MNIFIRFFLLITLYFSPSMASVVLNDTSKIFTDFDIAYLHDETSAMTIDDVSKSNFHPIPSQFSVGYKEGTGWFKITLTNKSSKSRFILSFSEPFWNRFDLYTPIAEGWKVENSGLQTPLIHRTIEDPSPAFIVDIPTGETKTYFIRGESASSHIGAFKIYTENEFFRPSRITLNTFYLFYTGILFIIVVINLFMWVEMKERIYGYYIGYVTTFIIFISMFSGSYLILGISGLSSGLHMTGAFVLIFMALFSSEFFQLKKFFPTMDKAFYVIITVFAIFALLIYFNVPYANLAFNIFSALFVSLLFYLAVITWLKGKVGTRYYLLALIVYMPSIGMMVLTFNTLLQNTNITRYSFLAGSIIEIILFSFILVSKFHKAKDEKIALQKAILSQKQKHQEHLEREVERQSREISQKNAILAHQSKNAALGEIIEMIAHQWRQPLNVLALINQDFYIRFNLGNCDRDYFESAHQQIDENLQYMSKTINDFRDFYTDDRTKHAENIEDVIASALHLSQVFLNYANIRIALNTNIPPQIPIIKNDLIQVLMNLIKNAHDAIVEQNIQNGKITINAVQNDQMITIEVCDNGGGIEDEVVNRLFEPYFSTKADHGTGLGLYMSREIIEKSFNGTLNFRNIPEGACFTIQFPLDAGE